MSKLFALILVVVLSGCSSELKIVGEIPISAHRVNDVMTLVESWRDSPVLVEYVEFSKTNYYSPVSGYLEVTGNSGDIDYSIYLNSIAHLCLSEEYSEIEGIRNAYHALGEHLATQIESGNERMYLRINNGVARIYNEK